MRTLILTFLLSLFASLGYCTTYLINDTDNTTGRLYNTGTVYNTAHNATSGTSAVATSPVGQDYTDPTYTIQRTVYRFDTSSIINDEYINNATLKVVLATDQSTTDFFLKCVQASDTLTTTIFYGAIYSGIQNNTSGDISTAVVLSDSISTSGKSAGDTLTFTFNGYGRSIISKTGVTQFWIISNKDIWKIAPTNSEGVILEDDSPYLTITTGILDSRNVIYNTDTTPIYNIDTTPIWKK